MYLALDTETGGLGLHTSLLTVSLVEADDNFKPTGRELNLFLIPDDGVYHVTPTGMDVNKIDLVEHSKTAITYKDARGKLYDFLNDTSSNTYRKKLGGQYTLVGKNVYGDVLQLWDKLIKRSTWEDFVSYHWIDLSSVWKWEKAMGQVPKLTKTSLASLCEHFNISTEDMHSARGDCLMTLAVFRELSNLYETTSQEIADEMQKYLVDGSHTLDSNAKMRECSINQGRASAEHS